MLKHFPLVKILCSARAPVRMPRTLTENTCSADRWREVKPYLSRVESPSELRIPQIDPCHPLL